MVFTSHNANLVVLSDSESVCLFESDGSVGRLEQQGFFSTRSHASRNTFSTSSMEGKGRYSYER